ncbi:hypothetical protein BH11BAC5_BH11BAC5_50020 [soil metagenome]
MYLLILHRRERNNFNAVLIFRPPTQLKTIKKILSTFGGGALLSVSTVLVYEIFPNEKQGTGSAIFAIGHFSGSCHNANTWRPH